MEGSATQPHRLAAEDLESVIVNHLQREDGVDNPFHANVFRQTIGLAAKLARSEGLIA